MAIDLSTTRRENLRQRASAGNAGSRCGTKNSPTILV